MPYYAKAVYMHERGVLAEVYAEDGFFATSSEKYKNVLRSLLPDGFVGSIFVYSHNSNLFRGFLQPLDEYE